MVTGTPTGSALLELVPPAETLGGLFDIPAQVEEREGEYRLW